MTELLAALVALLAILMTGALASPAAARTDNPADEFAERPLDALRYDRTHKCTGKAQRGALALRHWLEADRAGSDWGMYDCRKTRTGSSLSLRAEGRAINWRLDARARAATGRQQARAHAARRRPARPPFALAARMGIQEIIWNARSGPEAPADVPLQRLRRDQQRDPPAP